MTEGCNGGPPRASAPTGMRSSEFGMKGGRKPKSFAGAVPAAGNNPPVTAVGGDSPPLGKGPTKDGPPRASAPTEKIGMRNGGS